MIKDLLLRIAHKDDKAFEILYDITYKRIYIFIFRLIKDRNLTEDLVHDTYIKVWKNAQKYIPYFNDERWILRIARNVAYDELRKLKIRKDDMSRNLYEKSCQPLSMNEMNDPEILSCLNNDEKLAVKLKIAGYKQNQIALKTGWTIDRIKYLNRCIKHKLRKYID